MKKSSSFFLTLVLFFGLVSSPGINGASIFDLGFQFSSHLLSLPFVAVAYVWHTWLKKDIEKTKENLNLEIVNQIKKAADMHDKKFSAFQEQHNAFLGVIKINNEKVAALAKKFEEGQKELNGEYAKVNAQCCALKEGVKKMLSQSEKATKEELDNFAVALHEQLKELKEHADTIAQENEKRNKQLLTATRIPYQHAVKAIKECTETFEAQVTDLKNRYEQILNEKNDMKKKLDEQTTQFDALQKMLEAEREQVKKLKEKVHLLEEREKTNIKKMEELMRTLYPNYKKPLSSEFSTNSNANSPLHNQSWQNLSVKSASLPLGLGIGLQTQKLLAQGEKNS